MEREVPKYNHCFVCGPHNPSGLKLKFYTDGRTTKTKFFPKKQHEGYKGILHGGIMASILDEVMIKAILAQGILTVTAWMEVRFKVPAAIDAELIFEAEITHSKGKVVLASGRALDAHGIICAEANGKYLTVSREFESRLRESLED